MEESYHIPVMLKECIEGLNIKPSGVYVDITFGGGGHSKEILKHLNKEGKLLVFDQDQDAKKNADAFADNESFVFIPANFRYLKKYLKVNNITEIDGILMDLGVSSHQINEGSRGFSFRFSADLDMRMSQKGSKTAATVLNTYSEKDLHKIFGIYGEIRNAKTLANIVVGLRTEAEITTIDQFINAIRKFAPRGREHKYFAQVFQALRIEVNEEMLALEEVLLQSSELLKEGGRVVAMSYHSLEDRMLKNYFMKGKIKGGEVEKDFYGNVLRPLSPVNRKPICASKEELELNNRARSAKLRIAEKL